MSRPESDWNTGGGNRAADIADDHHPFPIPPVHERPGGEAEQEEGQGTERGGDTGLSRGMADREDQERSDDALDGAAKVRYTLAATQEEIIMITPQGDRTGGIGGCTTHGSSPDWSIDVHGKAVGHETTIAHRVADYIRQNTDVLCGSTRYYQV